MVGKSNVGKARTGKSAEKSTKAAQPKLFGVFCRNFNAALDAAGFPPLHYGRQVKVSQIFSISPSAARKWVMGESLPDWDNLIFIADTLNVSIDYLFGRGAKFNADESCEGAGHDVDPLADVHGGGMRYQHGDLRLFPPISDDSMLSPDGTGLGKGDVVVVDTKISKRLDELENDIVYQVVHEGVLVARRLHIGSDSVMIERDSDKASLSIPRELVQVYVPGETVLPAEGEAGCVIMGAVRWVLSSPRT